MRTGGKNRVDEIGAAAVGDVYNAKQLACALQDGGPRLFDHLDKRLADGAFAGQIQIHALPRRRFEKAAVQHLEGAFFQFRAQGDTEEDAFGAFFAVFGTGRLYSLKPEHFQHPREHVRRFVSLAGSDEGQDHAIAILFRCDADQAEGAGVAFDARAGIRRIEGVFDFDGNAGLHRRGDGRGIEHFRTAAGHIEGGLVGHIRNGPGRFHVFRIRRHNAGHIGPDLQAVSPDRGRVKGGAVIGSAAAEGRHGAVAVSGDKARSDKDLGLAFADGLFDAAIGLPEIVGDDQFARIQPQGPITVAAQFQRDQGRGQQLAEGDFFAIRRRVHLVKETLHLKLGLHALRTRKQAPGNGQMPIQQVLADRGLFLRLRLRLRIAQGQQAVRAAADRRADKHHALPF